MSQPVNPDPGPSDVAYDDMTRAWRNGDYPLAWSLADALLQYLANDGQPLTGDRDVYYARQVHEYYAPGRDSSDSVLRSTLKFNPAID